MEKKRLQFLSGIISENDEHTTSSNQTLSDGQLNELKKIVGKTVSKIDSDHHWDTTINIHFSDGTKLTIGKESYDFMKILLNGNEIIESS
jgi:hypothetical protein